MKGAIAWVLWALVGCDEGPAPIIDDSVVWRWTFADRECPGGIDHVSVVVTRAVLHDTVIEEEDVASSETPCTGRMSPIVLPRLTMDTNRWTTYADFVTADGSVYAHYTRTFDTFPSTPVATELEVEVPANHGYLALTTVFVDATTQAPLATCPHSLMSAIDATISRTRTPHTCAAVILPGAPEGSHRLYVAAFDGPSRSPTTRFGSVDQDVDITAGEVTPVTVMILE